MRAQLRSDVDMGIIMLVTNGILRTDCKTLNTRSKEVQSNVEFGLLSRSHKLIYNLVYRNQRSIKQLKFIYNITFKLDLICNDSSESLFCP